MKKPVKRENKRIESVGAYYIDPIALKTIAQKHGVENAQQLHEKTGVPYQTCHDLWVKGKILNFQGSTAAKFIEAFLVSPSALCVYSLERKYKDELFRS
jgi:hypothetical protein